MEVAPPAPNRTTAGQGTSMIAPRSNGDHAAGKATYRHWYSGIAGGAVTELAIGAKVVVAPPAFHRAAASQGAGEFFPSTYGNYAAGKPTHRHRCSGVIGCAIAELANIIDPPT